MRAGIGQPWLIGKLTAEKKNEPFQSPSEVEIQSVFLEHVERLIDLLRNEKFAILQARKFAKYYGRGLSNKIHFIEEINACDNFKKLKSICFNFFD